MKYTILLTPKQKDTLECVLEIVRRYVGFNVKLEPIEKTWESKLAEAKEYAYRSGYEDGKKQAINELPELANQENEIYNDGYNKGVEDFENLFVHEHDYEQFFEDTYGTKDPDYNLYDLVAKYGAKKVVDDFKKWQEEKKKDDEIEVGDEVIITGLKDLETIGVITMLANNNYTVICLINGSEMARVTKNDIKPTGRHFEEISQLLDKMRGEKK